jgi:hypothetical protein
MGATDAHPAEIIMMSIDRDHNALIKVTSEEQYNGNS